MPRLGSRKALVEAERKIDERHRYRDLAATLRLLRPDNTPGDLVLDDDGQSYIVGGRWDSFFGCWVAVDPGELQTVEWTVQEQQLPILLDLAAHPEVKFGAVLAGVQAGKTDGGLKIIAGDALRYPGRDSFVVSLEYKASRQPQDAFKALLDPAWGVEWVEKDQWFVFPHDHKVIFRSEKNIESLLGWPAKNILLDEASRMRIESVRLAMGRGVASKDFRLFITTTPERDSDVIHEIDETWGKDRESRVYNLRSDENPRSDKEYIKLLRSKLPADLVKQVLEGQVGPALDAAYAHLFRPGLHIRPPGQLPDRVRFRLERQPKDFTREFCRRENYDGEADFVGGWDFGKEAAVIAKVFVDTRIERDDRGRKKRIITIRLWIIAAETNLHRSTDMHAAHVRKKWGRRIAWITDATGQHKRSGGRGTEEKSGIEILREHGFAHVEPVASANPDVTDRHKTLCRALRSGLDVEGYDGENVWAWEDEQGGELDGGEVLVFIAPKGIPIEVQQPNGSTKTVIADGCPDLVAALKLQKYKNRQPVKDGKHEHVNDALGYLVYSVLPIEGGPLEGWEYPGRDVNAGDFFFGTED